jgi:hypothetical protein
LPRTTARGAGAAAGSAELNEIGKPEWHQAQRYEFWSYEYRVLSWRYLWSRPLAAGLNLLLLTLGLAAITLVLLASHQLDKAFERDLAGIDLVVGAKGSPLQLILAGVFHIDVPRATSRCKRCRRCRRTRWWRRSFR